MSHLTLSQRYQIGALRHFKPAPWDRGANEHNNKLIRQFIPKKIDFSQVSPKQLVAYQERINDRPRKKLNYSTPKEHIKSIFSTPVVAFQT
jgi:IS30 family transposase